MAKGKELETIVRLAGELDPSLEKTVKKAQKELDSMNKKLAKSGKATVNAWTIVKGILASKAIMGFGRLVTSTLSKIRSKIKEAADAGIQYASDLDEVQNVVSTTFVQNEKYIDAWSKTTLKKYGINELAAKKYASTIGAMLKSSEIPLDQIDTMSTSVAALAGDMASFYNLDSEVAFDKLRAALSGETEPMKQLGVDLSVVNMEAFAAAKGIKKAWKNMGQGEKTLLRYEYLMAKTKDAHGDFDKTLEDSYENQKRYFEGLKEDALGKVSKHAAPELTKVYGKLNSILEKIDWERLGNSVGLFVEKLAGIGLDVLDEFANADWDAAVDKIGEFTTQAGNVAQEIVKWATSVDWASVFSQIEYIVSQLSSFLSDPWGFVTGREKKEKKFSSGSRHEEKQKAVTKYKQTMAGALNPNDGTRGTVAGSYAPGREVTLTSAVETTRQAKETSETRPRYFEKKLSVTAEKNGKNYERTWAEANKNTEKGLRGVSKTAKSNFADIPAGAKSSLDQVNNYLDGEFSSRWTSKWQALGAVAANALKIGPISTGGISSASSVSAKTPIGPIASPYKLPAFANGGITDGPSVAGEGRRPEYVIPTDPQHRSRAQTLLASAANTLGIGTASAQTSAPSISVSYSPNITTNGGGLDRATILEVLKEDKQELIDLLLDAIEQRFGSSFNGKPEMIELFV